MNTAPILGYEEYIVDTLGNIYSIKSKKYLKPNISKTGYCSVELFKNKKSKRHLIHRLVAETFIKNPNNLPEVNHIDENKLNNSVENLEWCTPKYNMNYGQAAKTRHSKIDYTIEKRKIVARNNGKKKSKPVIQIKNQKIINKFESAAEAARKTNSHHSHILECCNKKRKQTNGYQWEFDNNERSDDLSVFQY